MAAMEQSDCHPSRAAWTQWAILVVATTVLAIAAGGRFLVGLVFDEMQQHFHMSHGGLGSVVSISVLMVGLGQPLVGWLVDRFSARVVAAGGLLLLGTGLIVVSQAGSGLGLVLGYGVLTGLGLATLTPTVMTPVVAAWFERRRTTALSIISAANPMGQSLVVPVLALLVTATGWQDGYFLLGLLVAAAGAPLIFLLLREQRRVTTTADWFTGCGVRQAVASRAWWQLALGFFVCGFTMAWVMTFFVDYALQHGLGRGLAATGLSLMGWMSLAGALATGWWQDRLGTTLPLSVVYALRGAGFGLLLLAGSWMPAILLAVAVIGFSWSATTPLTSSLCVALYGRRNLGTIFGLLFAIMPIGSAAGAALSGLLYDLTGAYQPSLLLNLVAGVLAAFVVLPIRVTPRFRPDRVPTAQPVPTTLAD